MLCKSCDELSDLPNFSTNKYKLSKDDTVCRDCGKQLTWDDFLYYIVQLKDVKNWTMKKRISYGGDKNRLHNEF